MNFRRRCSKFTINSFELSRSRLRAQVNTTQGRILSTRANGHYTTLGVPRNAKLSEIRQAYFKLAKKWHPDVNPSTEAQGKFSAISEAYEILSDKEMRSRYDQNSSSSWQNPYARSNNWSYGFNNYSGSKPSDEFYYDRETNSYYSNDWYSSQRSRGRSRKYSRDPHFGWEHNQDGSSSDEEFTGDFNGNREDFFRNFMRGQGFDYDEDYIYDYEYEEEVSKGKSKKQKKEEKAKQRKQKEEEKKEKKRLKKEAQEKEKIKREKQEKEKIKRDKQAADDRQAAKDEKEKHKKPESHDFSTKNHHRAVLEELQKQHPKLVLLLRDMQSSKWKKPVYSDGRGSYSVQLRLSFTEAMNGCVKTVDIRRFELCDVCNGKVSTPQTSTLVCKQCGGSGVSQQADEFLNVEENCKFCQGKGLSVNFCETCNGRGLLRKDARLIVSLKQGVQDGVRVRLTEGDASRYGGTRGNLYVHVCVSPHDYFVRSSNDIHLEVAVPLQLAVLGGTIKVPTISGKNHDLKVKAGSQSGDVLVISGQGAHDYNTRVRGNQYVHLKVKIPKNLDEEQKQAVLEYLGDGEPHIVMRS